MNTHHSIRETPVLLVVDDDSVMRLMLRRALERDGYVVVEAADGQTAMAEFVKHQPDMVLLDAVMPGVDGFEVCQWLRERPDGERCPCLLITGLNDDASVDRAFAAGATDFITKPIHWAVLRQRVRLLLQASRREYYLAYHDVVTGLPNRLKFADRLELVLAQARRHGHGLAVLCIDLDRFKLVNDTLGRRIGDKLLQELGGRYTACLREADIVARLSADEFIVLLDRLQSPDSLDPIARRVLEALQPAPMIDGHEITVTPSIGIAVYPTDGEDTASLIQHAATAMSRAKAQGGNRWEYYDAEMSVKMSRRWTMERGLRQAISAGELVLHYQPVMELAGGRLGGAEALLRWERPGEGIVLPAEFITLLEESGLIVPAGAQILDLACAQIREWRDGALPHFYVALNLSAVQLRSGDLPALVADALRRWEIPGEALVFEITESVLMERTHAVLDTLQGLRALGAQLAIDDFGTGYSSLAYLKRLPFDTLKIDQSFIKDLTADEDSAAIVAAIIALAHRLNRTVVAEGVKTEAQAALLRAYECDAGQGYLYSRPMPAQSFAEWVRQHVARGDARSRLLGPLTPLEGPGKAAVHPAADAFAISHRG
ncbi:MAG: EAL domain-containing protein [Pseudomonadota bacterium]|nr:EAL domain-containing protein [Pseudomonadota bacterium]